MDRIESLALLAEINLELNTKGRVSDLNNDALFELLEQFQGKTKQDIKEFFGDDLNNQDVTVFLNFFNNVETFKQIALELHQNSKLSKDTLKSFFVSKNTIDKILFTDAYREALHHIQTESTQKVKMEIFMDLHQYFKHGCYGADFGSKTVSAREIVEASAARNIGVQVIAERNTGYLTVEFVDTPKNKYGVAKAGVIDGVKITPAGLVIGFATSDGLIKSEDEEYQLEQHLAALEQGILQGKFNKDYAFNTYSVEDDFNITSVDQIAEVSFYSLARQYSEPVQASIDKLGLYREPLEFIKKCYGPVLDSNRISPALKSKISLEGVLHTSIGKDALANIGKFLCDEVKNLSDNAATISKNTQHEIVVSYTTTLCETIKDLGDFISQSSGKVIAKYLEKNQDLLTEITGSSRLVSKTIANAYSPDRTDVCDEVLKEIATNYNKHLDRQISLHTAKETALNEIRALLVDVYNVDNDELINKIGNKVSFTRFKPEELLYILTNKTWTYDTKKSFDIDVRQRLRMQKLTPDMQTLFDRLMDINPSQNKLKPMDVQPENISSFEM